MQHRVRCTPLHFVIPTIGAAELLINCSSTLFRNKWGGRVDSYYRGGIQISWRYTVKVSSSFSFAISVGGDPSLFFSFVRTEPRLFCFQDIPKSPPRFCHYRSPLTTVNYTQNGREGNCYIGQLIYLCFLLSARILDTRCGLYQFIKQPCIRLPDRIHLFP